MKYDLHRVLEITLDELAQALGLSPEAVERCRQQIVETLRPRWPVLFLATGDQPPSDAAIESFRRLTALGIEASLVRSHSFAQAWPSQVLRARLGAVSLLDDLGAEQTRRLPDCFPLLCVLTLTSNTVAKTILGLYDAVPPRVLRVFLERGQAVVAVGLPPQRLAVDEETAPFWGLPQAVRLWLLEGYRTLEQWGVEFVRDEQLAEAVCRRFFGHENIGASAQSATRNPRSEIRAEGAEPPARGFITSDDVRSAWMRRERQIAVPRHVTVTDEARDFARRWGILLVE